MGINYSICITGAEYKTIKICTTYHYGLQLVGYILQHRGLAQIKCLSSNAARMSGITNCHLFPFCNNVFPTNDSHHFLLKDVFCSALYLKLDCCFFSFEKENVEDLLILINRRQLWENVKKMLLSKPF